jgi:hypothetical protein
MQPSQELVATLMVPQIAKANAACAAHRAAVLTSDLPREWPQPIIVARTVLPYPFALLAYLSTTSLHS